jgi:hypothetical protein
MSGETWLIVGALVVVTVALKVGIWLTIRTLKRRDAEMKARRDRA